MHRTFFIVTCALLSSAVSGGTSMAQDKRVKFEAFTIDVPGDIKVTKQAPVEDFELISFSRDKKVILTVYVGNHPSFPTAAMKGSKNEIRESKLLNAYIVTEWKGVTLLRKEIRIRLGREWPAFLHFFSGAELTRTEAGIVEKMLSSIVIVE